MTKGDITRRVQAHYNDNGKVPDCLYVTKEELDELDKTLFKDENANGYYYGDRYALVDIQGDDGNIISASIRINF